MPSLPLVQPEPLLAPLNAASQQALTELLQTQTTRKRLAVHFNHATTCLTTVAGQLNDRGTERFQRRAKRLARDGEEEDEQEKTEHEQFQKRVESLTRKMEEGVRDVIDEQHWVEGVSDALKQVARRSVASAETTRRQSQAFTQASTRRQSEPDGPDDGDEREEDEAQGDDVGIPAQPQPSEAPISLLQAFLKERKTEWTSMSLTGRYANSNDYIGFYKTVYDAKHPGDNAPPVPHSSLWFAGEENRDGLSAARSQTNKGRHADAEEDSDLEIAAERISTKCPITFLPFKDPLTSTKCPHSFERGAILEMLKHSSTALPFTAEQVEELNKVSDGRARVRREEEIRTPTIKCPVCSVLLLAADLRPDPVLLRKVKRIEAARREQDEGASDVDDDDEEAPQGTQRKPVGLGSSPPRRSSGRAEKVKKERARSVVPQRMPGPSSGTPVNATAVDLGAVDEEDEDGDGETSGE